MHSLEPPSKENKYHTIHTSRGICHARHIVNATNAWIGHLYPEFQGKIVPARGQVIHVECNHLKLSPMDWNYGGEYLVQRPDSTLIFGGGRRFSRSSTPREQRNSNSRTCGNRKRRQHHDRSLRLAIPTHFPALSILIHEDTWN